MESSSGIITSLLRWVFLICFICSIGSLEALNHTCSPNDLLALKQFAGNLTRGTIISSWSNTSCCSWDGVVCEAIEDGSSRVTELKLSNKGLTGVISRSLSQLDQLKMIDLSFNRLHGGLPLGLSYLKQLVYLDLSHNLLMGSILKPFAGLESIRSLNISSNQFNGPFSDFGVFPNIAVFNISNNSFAGQLDSRICRSNKIQIIDVSMNRLAGGLHSLRNCTSSLRQLHVDLNDMSGLLPDFVYSMSSLEELTVSQNNFSGPISKELSKLSGLRSFKICRNRFSGPFPDVFRNFTRLEKLSVNTNSLLGSLPSSISMCNKLKVLDLRNNSFTGHINIDFTALTSLCVLDLGSNHLNGTLPSSLSKCQDLKMFSVAKNNLSGEVPKSFGDLKSISFLSLSNNSFTNLSSALSTLQQCKNLSTLILTKNFRGEELPRNVSGFEGLLILALGNCVLSGQIPEWLLHCPKLQVLDLSWNHLNGSIPPWIGRMESLFYLDFSNNTLSGELPESLTQLKSIISLNISSLSDSEAIGAPLYVRRNRSDNSLQYNQVTSFPPSILLSNNSLTGAISSDIGRLKELHVLDLSRNKITGTIPGSISNLENLEILDLSYNDLHGGIPSSLNKLTFLSKFSVAYNHLEGQIPTGAQFMSFPNSSFAGNPGLCGPMYSSTCAVVDNISHGGNNSSSSSSKFGRNSILGVTISIGVGIALLLAVVLFKISSKESKDPVDYMGEEDSGPISSREGIPTSKLVLFQTDCKDLTVGELLKSTDNFSQANIIGCGGFGLVYKATLPNDTKVAIKRLSGDCGQMEREFRAEVEALSRAQHKNLVSLQGYCQLGNDRLLIYSFMENGSLDYWLHESIDGSSVLDWESRLKIAQGAGHGLAYLHKVCEPTIVHRDVKSSNILLDEKFEAHLADFGLSRLLRPCDTHVTTDLVGTLGYIPPEYSQTLTATFKGDVYSFGVVLLELVTGRRPVEVCKGKNCRDLRSWVFQMKMERREEEVIDSVIWGKEHDKQVLEVLGLACKCLDQDPKQRPSIDQVVSWLDVVGRV